MMALGPVSKGPLPPVINRIVSKSVLKKARRCTARILAVYGNVSRRLSHYRPGRPDRYLGGAFANEPGA